MDDIVMLEIRKFAKGMEFFRYRNRAFSPNSNKRFFSNSSQSIQYH